MGENKIDYVVFFKGAKKKYFAITSPRKDEFSNFAVFHGIGFWGSGDIDYNISDKKIVEVWIPWNNIDHVVSLMYRQRS